MKMQGLNMKSMQKNPALVPLYFCLGVGALGAVFYTLRIATRTPDVSWTNKKKAEPWNYYSQKQYKFYCNDPEQDSQHSPAPKY